jgi:hypothetical protein
VRFAFRNLDSQFAILSAFGSAMTALVVPLLVAIALWTVAALAGTVELRRDARPSSRSGLLDVRQQAAGPSAHAALTMRTTVAYALAFAGALLLIESMMYLLTAGSTSNKLATLAIACQHREPSAGLRGQSERWAVRFRFSCLSPSME